MRKATLITMTFTTLILAACAKPNSGMNYSPTSAPTAQTQDEKQNSSDAVAQTLKDYISKQHGETSLDKASDIMSWVTNKDLANVPLVGKTVYRAEENNLELDRVRQNLHLQSKTPITSDSYLMMRGKPTTLNDAEGEKKFEQGVSTVCQVSKSTLRTIEPTNFRLIEANVSHTAEFNMIDIQWKEPRGASVFTRCLSRQPFTLGDLRAALQNQFVISVK